MSHVAQGRERSVLRVRRQRGLKHGPLLVEVEARRRRTVLFHRPEHLRQPGQPSLRQPELLQELSDAPVAGGRGSHLGVRDQVPVLDAGNGPRIADDLHPTRKEVDLRRLRLIDVVSAVVHRVDERLPQGRHGIAHPPANAAAVLLLLEMRRREVLEVAQAAANLIHEPSPEDALLLHVPGSIRGELHDLDSRAAKPLHRLAGEEQEPDVPGRLVIVDLRREPHAPVDVAGVRLVEEPATHVAQVLANLRLAEILHPCIRRPAIVPGHAGGLLHEPLEQAAALFGVHRLRPATHPVADPTAALGRCAVRSHLAGGRPDDQDEPVADRLRRQDGGIGRVQAVAVAADPLLRRFDLLGRQAGRRQDSPSVPLLDADDDVAAVQVVVVVREGADGPEHLDPGGARIPRRLELDPLRLHPAAVQQCIEIDRQDRAHAGIIGHPRRPRARCPPGRLSTAQAPEVRDEMAQAVMQPVRAGG